MQVVQRLVEVAERDDELRQHLRVAAQEILTLTEPEQAESAAALSESEPIEAAVVRSAPVLTVAQAAAAIKLDTGVLDVSAIRKDDDTGSAAPAAEFEVADADLPLIEHRLRLKAEAARWSATRQRRFSDDADFYVEIEPVDREIIEQAKELPDCFLWMSHSSGPSPADLSLLEDLGGCFEVAADAVSLVRSCLGEESAGDGALDRALELMAEAQSALRAAVEDVGYNHDDKDQVRMFRWLRTMCRRPEHFIPRYMKNDDMADPIAWADLSERINQLDEQIEQRRQKAKHYKFRLNKIRYHLKNIMRDPDDHQLHDWRVIIETVDAMVSGGVPPSDINLRSLLMPVVDDLPEVTLPDTVQQVLREIDRYIATRPTSDSEGAVAPTEDVVAVRDLLRDSVVVLIGGDRRLPAQEALTDAFQLRALEWVATREHDSVATFEPHIARRDVAVVLLAIRWSSHSFGEVRHFCDRYNKPLVRLPGGYNPNQVALQILNQCGERLRNPG